MTESLEPTLFPFLIFGGLLAAALFGLIWPKFRSGNLTPSSEAMRRGLEGFGWVYLIIWAFLFLATFWALALVFFGQESALAPKDGNALGLGALIAALLGAPFVIWGTVLKHQTAMFQKEGHMTDRIHKAVEILGSTKTVEWIGRPVRILSGVPSFSTYYGSNNNPPELSLLQKLNSSTRSTTQFWDDEADKVVEQEEIQYEIKSWPKIITQVEREGLPLKLEEFEEVLDFGDWQVFKKTEPNLEVRIGAILALQRIAQDSIKHYDGRDHVRVLKILCAYVKENSPCKTLEPTKRPYSKKYPRQDIQVAIDVLKSRSSAQQFYENSVRFRIDLRNCDLDGCDFSDGSLQGVLFSGSRLEFASFAGANLTAAQMTKCILNDADFFECKLVGTMMDAAIYSNADHSKTINVDLNGLMMEGADMRGWRFGDRRKVANIFGSADTIVPDYYRDEHLQAIAAIPELESMELGIGYDDEKFKEILKMKFIHWNPGKFDGIFISKERDKFRRSRGHVGWPYDD